MGRIPDDDRVQSAHPAQYDLDVFHVVHFRLDRGSEIKTFSEE